MTRYVETKCLACHEPARAFEEEEREVKGRRVIYFVAYCRRCEGELRRARALDAPDLRQLTTR
ncbi:MAG TPA: hypothetical protein VLI67_09430 [Vicinamibacteria bacterium]|nr:hypothetical protein [Vicinamibacteria bacterium]